ncbi:MAG: glycosyltransferase family 4 protein [Pseudomonadota bacterium]
MRRLAVTYGFIDRPNERSSHRNPTPRGGGSAIVAVVTLSLTVLVLLGRIPFATFAVLAAGGFAVALVGFIDDRRPVSTRVRLSVHIAAAIWALYWLDGLAPLRFGDRLIDFGWAGYVLGGLGIVWMLNLFNFMDGIDGIATSEAGFIALSAAFLLSSGDFTTGIPAIGIVLGAACCGFLVWNWPPAKIFMGDVGSGYLGYFLACTALAAGRENPTALFVFLVLGAVFVADATVTFLRRVARRERYDVAHRTHAYQHLSRCWGSHKAVTAAVLAINLSVLLPTAAWAIRHPKWAGCAAAAASLLLVVAALAAGAGRREGGTAK